MSKEIQDCRNENMSLKDKLERFENPKSNKKKISENFFSGILSRC